MTHTFTSEYGMTAEKRSGEDRKIWSTPELSVVAADQAKDAAAGDLDGYGLS